MIENYGQVQVTSQKDGKPLPKNLHQGVRAVAEWAN